jgi:hypothetical protein
VETVPLVETPAGEMSEPEPCSVTPAARAPTLTDIRFSAACSTMRPAFVERNLLPPRTRDSTTAMARLKTKLARKIAMGLASRSVLAMMPLTVTP